jgi:alcohol dehydrogenase class IV
MPALLNALGVSSLGEAEARLTQMLERCGLETRLSGLGLTEGDVGTLVDNIKWQLADRMPRALEKEDARVILQELF